MLKINTLTKHYICCARSKFDNVTRDCNIEGIISQQYSDTLCYTYTREIPKEQLATIDREQYDVFEYQTVEVNLCDSRWREVICDSKLTANLYSQALFMKTCNLYLKKHGYSEIIHIYNIKSAILSLIHLQRELDKKRKFITFAILKDSIKYIPTDKYPECALKNDYKLKIFNQMYAPSIEVGLESVGLVKYDYCEFAELQEGGDIIRLSLRVKQKFRNELFATLMALKNEILAKMFNGKFKLILDSNKMNIDSVFASLIERLDQSYGQLDLKIPTKDIV